ncbi:RraA family protein [Kribbella sancticallisti]|uniref:Putative 4-hydroxy-4-methyl-2-oxoglutarate aldolase n=1 Tax=Kribbella sancticallisti TaxID=460087 RepID=A0ABN2DSH6_9ACTN
MNFTSRNLSQAVDDLSPLSVAVVADTLDRLSHRNQVVHPRVRHMAGPARLLGRVRTVKVEAVDAAPSEPYAVLLAAIDTASRGDVLVMDAGGQATSGLFGGLLANACRVAGVEGAVIDGGLRDLAELGKLDFPTFGAATHPSDSYSRQEVVAFDVPVQLGGVRVNPGDHLMADSDGVVVIPGSIVDQVVERALQKIDTEAEMRAALRNGMRLREAFDTYGVL